MRLVWTWASRMWSSIATAGSGNPRHLKGRLRHLKRQQRRLSRMKNRVTGGIGNGSRLRGFMRIAAMRQDFLHKTTTALIRRADVLALEDLNVGGMMKIITLRARLPMSGWGVPAAVGSQGGVEWPRIADCWPVCANQQDLFGMPACYGQDAAIGAAMDLPRVRRKARPRYQCGAEIS